MNTTSSKSAIDNLENIIKDIKSEYLGKLRDLEAYYLRIPPLLRVEVQSDPEILKLSQVLTLSQKVAVALKGGKKQHRLSRKKVLNVLSATEWKSDATIAKSAGSDKVETVSKILVEFLGKKLVEKKKGDGQEVLWKKV